MQNGQKQVYDAVGRHIKAWGYRTERRRLAGSPDTQQKSKISSDRDRPGRKLWRDGKGRRRIRLDQRHPLRRGQEGKPDRAERWRDLRSDGPQLLPQSHRRPERRTRNLEFS